jgi:uncharacterized protein
VTDANADLDHDAEDLDDDVDEHNRVDPNQVQGEHARSVLEYIVESIVEDPDGVEVELDDRGKRARLNVSVSDGDMGRVIGKRGRVANAIRTVVRAAAVRDELDVDVEFLD